MVDQEDCLLEVQYLLKSLWVRKKVPVFGRQVDEASMADDLVRLEAIRPTWSKTRRND